MHPTNGVIFPLLGIILIGVKISGKWVILSNANRTKFHNLFSKKRFLTKLDDKNFDFDYIFN